MGWTPGDTLRFLAGKWCIQEKIPEKLHPGRLTAGTYSHHPWNVQGKWSEPNLYEDMFHVNFPGWKVPRILYFCKSITFGRNRNGNHERELQPVFGLASRFRSEKIHLQKKKTKYYLNETKYMFYVPSRELTYPQKMAFWRWFSFSQGGIC